MKPSKPFHFQQEFVTEEAAYFGASVGGPCRQWSPISLVTKWNEKSIFFLTKFEQLLVVIATHCSVSGILSLKSEK